jgi:hypothetical protein
MERFVDALEFHSTAAAIQRELGDQWLLAIALNNMGVALLGMGERSRAAQHWTESLELLAVYTDPKAVRLRQEISQKLDANK